MSVMPSKDKATGMYRKMYEIRQYEETVKYLFFPAPSTRVQARRRLRSVRYTTCAARMLFFQRTVLRDTTLQRACRSAR